MALLGVSTLAELQPRHVTQLTRLVPVGDSAGASATGSGRASRTQRQDRPISRSHRR